ncbi:CsiV family protein [Pseudomonadota bacterium]
MWQFSVRIQQFLVVAIFSTLTGINAANGANKYDVEVLVFKTLKTGSNIHTSGNEIWKEDRVSALSSILPKNNSVNNSKNNSVSYKTGRKLAYHLNQLKQNPNYHILEYKSWSQRPLNKKRSPSVPFSSGTKDNGDLANAKYSEIEGSVKFYLGSFLQLDLNLTYSPQPNLGMDSKVDNASTDQQVVMAKQKYSIQEKRRVKINEINYFDHPTFGAIAVVYPSDEKLKSK